MADISKKVINTAANYVDAASTTVNAVLAIPGDIANGICNGLSDLYNNTVGKIYDATLGKWINNSSDSTLTDISSISESYSTKIQAYKTALSTFVLQSANYQNTYRNYIYTYERDASLLKEKMVREVQLAVKDELQ